MNCDVYIDDVKVGELAAQNAGAMHKQKLFEKKDLANTKHTLRVVPKEGESIEGKVIQLDKIVVFHDEITVPDSIVLNRTELTMTPGASSELTASVIPWNANAKLVWTSSDSSVVEVNDGKLTAKEIDVKKTVTVTAASAEDNSVLAEAKITVDPALAFMNAYVGNEKLLETELDYDKLKAGNGSVYNGTAWLNDELNSKIVVTTEKTFTMFRLQQVISRMKRDRFCQKTILILNGSKKLRQKKDVTHRGRQKLSGCDLQRREERYRCTRCTVCMGKYRDSERYSGRKLYRYDYGFGGRIRQAVRAYVQHRSAEPCTAGAGGNRTASLAASVFSCELLFRFR